MQSVSNQHNNDKIRESDNNNQSTEKNLLILMIDGGFCSQLLKYALGEFLKRKLGAHVKYDTSWFTTCGMDCDGKETRELVIHKLFPSIEFPIATEEEIRRYKKKRNSYCNPAPFQFCKKLLSLKLPIYVSGYYDNIVYMQEVRDILLEKADFSRWELDDNNKNLLSKIRQEKRSCAVHVRRGDYVKLGIAFLTPAYYASAIRKVQEDCSEPVHFFFFSNDPEYVRQHIIPECPDIQYTIVDANTNDTGYLDLYLISQCWAQVSSNSAFGFWGAFLNRHADKYVVLPSKWVPADPPVFGSIGQGALAHYMDNAQLIDENGNAQPLEQYKPLLGKAIRESHRKQRSMIRWANFKRWFRRFISPDP